LGGKNFERDGGGFALAKFLDESWDEKVKNYSINLFPYMRLYAGAAAPAVYTADLWSAIVVENLEGGVEVSFAALTKV